MTGTLIAAICLTMLGFAHSFLGERKLLQPLFAADWKVGIPREPAEKVFRFAWHITSVAWFALAAVLVDAPTQLAVAAMCLTSAAVIFVTVRGHLAWPLFLLGGLGALYDYGWLSGSILQAAGIAAAVVLVAAAILHFYWALGGTWAAKNAVPEVHHLENKSWPGPLITAAVALLLLVFAGLIVVVAFTAEARLFAWLVGVGIALLTIRAIGDGRYAGFTKTERSTAFGRLDDAIYTPLIVALALGATAGLLA